MDMSAEFKHEKEKTLEKRLFELECHISIQDEFIQQLVKELNQSGIKVSTKIND